MFTLKTAIRFSIFLGFLFFCITVYTQQLSDEIRLKMSESDQKKLHKTDAIYTKGELILSQSGYQGDEQILKSINEGSKDIKKQLSSRVEAASYFGEVNATKYNIYEEYIKKFWKDFTGNKSALDFVKQKETAAVDSFTHAQQIRKESGKKSKPAEKVPLIIKAENIENKAIITLQKVLITYFYYPAQYPVEWETQKTNETSKVQQVVEKKDTVKALTPKPISKTDSTPETKNQQVSKVHFNKNDSSLYSLVNINEDQIDLFNKFLQKTYPSDYEKYIIDFQSIDYSNMQELRDKWYSYRYATYGDSMQMYASKTGTNIDSTQKALALNALDTGTSKIQEPQKQIKTNKGQGKGNEIVQQTQQIKSTENQALALNEVSKGKTQTSQKTSSTEKTKQTKSGKSSDIAINTKTSTKHSESPNYNKSDKTDIASGFLYRVQIAACRVTLEPKIISSIYDGTEILVETFEDNWYKYSIGKYDTYTDARKIRDQVNIPGAFVVAYMNGKRIQITPSNLFGVQGIDNIIPANIKPELIAYKIQFAASKVPLSDEFLRTIYKGQLKIESKLEDGWYKYMLHAGNTLRSARELVNEINIPNAFMVTYYEDEKINLYTAIKLTKYN